MPRKPRNAQNLHEPEPASIRVIRWTTNKIRAHCSFCKTTHTHYFSAPLDPNSDITAKPGWKLQGESELDVECCGNQYHLIFPGESKYGWEVDREGQQFIAVDQRGPVRMSVPPENDFFHGRTLLPRYEMPLELAFQVHQNNDEAPNATTTAPNHDLAVTDHLPMILFNAELAGNPLFRQSMFFDLCHWAEHGVLSRLCQMYPDLIESVDTEGTTGVHAAARGNDGLCGRQLLQRQGFPTMNDALGKASPWSIFLATGNKVWRTLDYLRVRGAPLDGADHFGRTPLMEASLRGRWRNVQYLVEHDADVNACDGNGMCAADFAAHSQRNVRERAARFGSDFQETLAYACARRHILNYLKLFPSPDRPTGNPAATSSTFPLNKRAFFRWRGSHLIDWNEPALDAAEYGVEIAYATLDRDSPYPSINAMNGYVRSGWPNVIKSKKWAEKVRKLRVLLGLPDHQSEPTHVEPQLLTYLVDKHSLHDIGDGDEHGDCSHGLASVLPPYNLRPSIMVHRSMPCANCDEFFECFNARFPELKVTVHIMDSTGYIQHTRRWETFAATS